MRSLRWSPASAWTAALLGALLAFACETRPHGGEAQVGRSRIAPSERPAEEPAEPLEFVERCLGAPCEARLPLLVVIHGLGDSPEAFVELYGALRGPVRVIALRAPLAWGGGHAWFPYRSASTSPETIAGALAALVPRVRATVRTVCERRSCDGRVFVSGFSQGGMLSYALAALAPAEIALAVPIGGFLPVGIEPERSGNRPRIVAFHGDADGVVSPDLDRSGAERLRSAGYDLTLTLAPGVGHTVPPAMRSQILRVIDEALAGR